MYAYRIVITKTLPDGMVVEDSFRTTEDMVETHIKALDLRLSNGEIDIWRFESLKDGSVFIDSTDNEPAND